MYSDEHIKYLKKIKKGKIKVIIFRFLIIFIFLFIWQLLADLKVINSFLFSSPSLIYRETINLVNNNNLFMHIFVTIYETIISFILASSLGIVIAGILWSNRTLALILEPYFTILNSLPKVALGPMIIIWFGASIKSIIFMALLISLIITILNTYQNFISVDKNKIKLMKSFKANKYQMFFKLVLPINISNIISTLKINISMCLIGVIMGEFLVSKKGIGYLILYGSQVFNLTLVLTGIVILCIVASIMYYSINYLEKKITKKLV